MKARLPILIACLAVGATVYTIRAPAEFEVSAGISISAPSDFYDPLAGLGSWIQLGDVGRCWRPAGVSSVWRPYSDGYWEWTDCGWYWVSDEPWAWACYHYGTWMYDPSYGWVWIPGTEWAPAWVNWRTGDDYIGWAPCGPSGVTMDPNSYVFIRGNHFHDHIRPDMVVANDPDIINRTRQISNVSRQQRDIGGRQQTVFVNEGPGLASIERTTGHKFSQTSVQQAYQRTVSSAPAKLKRQTYEPEVRQQGARETRQSYSPTGNVPSAGGGTPEALPRAYDQNRQMPAEVPKGNGTELPVPLTPREQTSPSSVPSERIVPSPSDRATPQGNSLSTEHAQSSYHNPSYQTGPRFRGNPVPHQAQPQQRAVAPQETPQSQGREERPASPQTQENNRQQPERQEHNGP